MQQEIGSLLHLYIDDIESSKAVEESEYLITKSASALENSPGQRNWLPVIVKQIDLDKYLAIANHFVLAVAEKAEVEKVWCIVIDESEESAQCAQLLAKEKIPQINLTYAEYDEIYLGLKYLKQRSSNPLKRVDINKTASKIDESPRKYWQTSLKEVQKLGCSLTSNNFKVFKEVFYTTPEPLPDVITDVALLETFNATALKKMAKKRGFSGYSKFKKAELVKLLSTEE